MRAGNLRGRQRKRSCPTSRDMARMNHASWALWARASRRIVFATAVIAVQARAETPLSAFCADNADRLQVHQSYIYWLGMGAPCAAVVDPGI